MKCCHCKKNLKTINVKIYITILAYIFKKEKTSRIIEGTFPNTQNYCIKCAKLLNEKITGTTNTIEEATILNIEYSYQLMNVYSLDVEPIDALLTAEEGVETPIYSIFQHNLAGCTQMCCDGSYWPNQYPQCPATGNSGICYYTYTYDYCIEGSFGTPPGCYECLSACLGQCLGGGTKV
jgi:hypothetical protein